MGSGRIAIAPTGRGSVPVGPHPACRAACHFASDGSCQCAYGGVNAQNAFGTNDAAELLLPPLPFERNRYSRLNSLPPAGSTATSPSDLAQRPDSLVNRDGRADPPPVTASLSLRPDATKSRHISMSN